ncbi:thiamine diphosphokinase [Fictibacillus nanhaiensis]|uniref:thiamine diphosphokinase n=1 Tax=Fictibacillus nanhaiensis TaxID=742169 RepID=UPI002E1E07CE|nr:thiamine diphosphokinase [Fictibacillus nanhaiensis]MED1864280.1 thiamine diphosphokinase [Fictibacillus nanhaiensis]
MKISIVAGGPELLIPDLKPYDLASDHIWIGVDRGTLFLLRSGFFPQHAYGDFDSVSDDEKRIIMNSSIKVNQYQSEKDATDMEIALEWALKQNPEQILIFGATGGRLDHELMNIQLLYRTLSVRADVRILDTRNEISLHLPGCYNIEQDHRYSYISFLAKSEKVTGITLEGFKYPLEQADLQAGSSLCVSNELVNKSGTYSFDSGIILMVKSRD